MPTTLPRDTAPDSPEDWTGARLGDVPEAVRVVKRPAMVWVDFAPHDGVLQTIEGPVKYLAGDALVQGDHDDKWPVTRKKFDASYMPAPHDDDARRAESGLFIKRPNAVWALRIDRPFIVTVGHAKSRLNGKPGDWLLQYRSGDYGIVDGHVFLATYAPAQ